MAYVRRVVELPRVYEVAPDHPIHRTTLFTVPLEIRGQLFHSVEQVFYACLLAQHGLFDDAINIWFDYTHCESLPCEIRSLVEGCLSRRNLDIKASWTLYMREVLEQIVNTLLADEAGDFAKCFRDVYERYGANVQFVEVTNSKTERVFSAGHKPGCLPSHPNRYAGANTYGQVLTGLYLYYVGAVDSDYYESLPRLQCVLTRFIRPVTSYQHTVLIISDSTFRHATDVEGGDIWIQTGKTFGELAQLIQQKHGNLQAFKYIIICAGTNDSKMFENEDEYETSWLMMFNLLKPLRNHPETLVCINSGIGVPSLPKIRPYTEWFRHTYGQYLGGISNFHMLDWSTSSEDNFFINSDGSANRRYLDKGKNSSYDHPNSPGTRRIWQVNCRTFDHYHGGNASAVRLSTAANIYAIESINQRSTLSTPVRR